MTFSVQRRPATHVAVPDPPKPSSPGPARSHGAAALSAAARSLVRGSTRARPTANAAPSSAAIQSKLNRFMARAASPYRMAGKDVRALPAFRMNGGMNQGKASEYVARIQRALAPDVFRKVAADVGHVTAGKGSPEQLHRVTQALIDSPIGKHYSATETGLRQLMWDHGIGMDCSGYVHHAFLAARGVAAEGAARFGLGDPLVSGLQAPSSSVFARVEPRNARPGDLIVLTNGSDGTGHKVIVFARHEVPPGTQMHERTSKAFGGSANSRIHLLEVDSSWGAGGQPERGGVQRRVWAYDEGSRRWASLEKDSRGQWHAFASQKLGPYDHDLQGIYRPKVDR